MATPADFLPFVMPYVAGCSYPLAEQQIVSVCRDFCTYAAVVQEQLDPFDAVQGQATYDIDTAYGSDVTLVLQAAFQGRPLVCVKTSDHPMAFMTAQPGAPTAFRQAADNTLTFDYAPIEDAPKAISLFVATKPRMGASRLADVLLNDYADAIAQGVVGRLMKMPGHAFSNPRDAGAYIAPYVIARTEARIRADMSFGSGQSRVRPRPFQ